jgi:hypothetical protein
MRYSHLNAAYSLLAPAVLLIFVHTALAVESSLFERDILPLLTKNCLGCHGGLKQEGKLDLRTLPSMLKGGETGPAVHKGDLKQSELWLKVEANDMPPGDKKLPAHEKELLKSWILAGLPTVSDRLQEDPPLLAPGRHEPQETAAAIDRHIERSLSAASLPPVGLSDDAEFLRRLYLDLTGRVPTAEQAKRFLENQQADKRPQLIDELLAKPQFGEQFGRTWREWICPPELPSDMNGGKQPHQQSHELGVWLGKRFAAGDTWDRIVRDILTVEGDIKNQPHVIYYGLVGQDGKPQAAGTARSVASLFLGVQLQCAECHDDPYRDWSQRQHWALAAFFRQVGGDFNKISDSPGDVKQPSKDKSGFGQIAIPASAFKNTGATIPAAYLGEEALPLNSGDKLRVKLAEWVTARNNPYFARAFANRLWFYFFTRGLVHPVDDFRDLNPPSHPGLMQLLANEFAHSGFDVKHLVRCICNSQTYQRTSRKPAGVSDQQWAALQFSFGRMPLRVMSADMLYDSLKLAYGEEKLDLRNVDPKSGNTNGESAAVGDAYLEFLRRFGVNEDDATDFTHGIPQMLALMNHPRLLQTSKSLEGYLKKNPATSAENVTAWLYLSTLSRSPTAEETAEAQRYFAKAGEPLAGYQGLLWSLVNRSEFLLVR